MIQLPLPGHGSQDGERRLVGMRPLRGHDLVPGSYVAQATSARQIANHGASSRSDEPGKAEVDSRLLQNL